MKRIVLILAWLAVSSVPSSAMWAYISTEELVQDSDLIVVGTLDNVTEYSKNGIDFAQGTITVEEAIWGTASPGSILTLKWQNESDLVCPRVEHRHNQKKSGIWLLNVQNDGVVQANYPGRFVDLSERTTVEQGLVRNKIRLRTTQLFFPPNEPLIVSMVFRNAMQDPVAFPGVEYNNGRLTFGPGLVLAVRHGYGEGLTIDKPIPGRVVMSRTLAPIIVAPRQEVTVGIDVRELFSIANDQTYVLQLRSKGLGRPSNIFVYTGPPPPELADHAINRSAPREPISRLKLLIPSALAIIVSSIFVFHHARELGYDMTTS
ncbi:MAG TPA: hypothetical protein VKN18_05165 [Blastocatellia bacterium]|nr:hypothetical protein [Blastocatellia bacterium]